MNIEQQKSIADLVLDNLECIDINALLAGGAPRDWSFDGLARDLDFYFYANPERFNVSKMLGKLKSYGLPTFIKNGYNYDNKNPHLRLVFDGMFKDMKVQLMWMDVPAIEAVNLFALDICQVWYKDGEIHKTDSFVQSVESKTIHILNPLYGKQDKYIQKVHDKFPDFLLVDEYETKTT